MNTDNQSRNRREGHYRSPLNKDKTAPQYTEFMRERKRGRKSRQITAQYFYNGDKYEWHNCRGPNPDAPVGSQRGDKALLVMSIPH